VGETELTFMLSLRGEEGEQVQPHQLGSGKHIHGLI
jgi:hypothetical protein